MDRIQTKRLSKTPFGVKDVVTWHQGKHLIGVAKNMTFLVKENGEVLQFAPTSRIVFLAGKTKDVILTQEEEGLINISVLESEIVALLIRVKAREVSGAHLVKDKMVVLVTEGIVKGVDITYEGSDLIDIFGFRIANEAISAISGHHLAIWTKDARYIKDLEEGPISALAKTPPQKTYLGIPLTLDKTITFAEHDLLVAESRSEIVVYDSTGSVIFREAQKHGFQFSRLERTFHRGFGFFCDDRLYYSQGHTIQTKQLDPTTKRWCVVLDGSPYIYNPTTGCLDSIDLYVSRKEDLTSGVKIVTSKTNPTFSVITDGFVERYTLCSFLPLPNLNVIEKEKRSGLNEKITPFLQQLQYQCLIWKYNRELALLVCKEIYEDGTPGKQWTFNIDGIINKDQDFGAEWKSSKDWVCLRLGNKITLFQSQKWVKSAIASITDDDILQDFYAYENKGFWLCFSSKKSPTTLGKVFHTNEKLEFTDVSHETNKFFANKSACTNTGRLLMHSRELETCSTIRFDNNKKLVIEVLPKTTCYIKNADNGAYIVEISSDKKYSVLAVEDGEELHRRLIAEKIENIGKINDLYIGKRTILVGSKKYALVTLGNNQTIEYCESPKENLAVIAPPRTVDPLERSVFLYNEKLIFHIDDPLSPHQNAFRNPENTVFSKPRHLISCITVKIPSTIFDSGLEDVVVSYVL